MPLKTRLHRQFMALIINDCETNYHHQNITIATKYNDILMLIETTQFDLIILDLTVSCSAALVPDQLRHSRHPWQSAALVPDQLRHSRHPWQSEIIARIKDPLCKNNKTPIIAAINPTQEIQKEEQYLFEDWLIKPISEERLNEVIDLWQTKTLALAYIQSILNRTKNNRSLTATLFEKLFKELPLQTIEIKTALENKQYDLAQEITHKLNGSVSFCGLMDIQQSANALESSLINNYANIHQQFITLEQYTLNFTRHQETIRANLSNG
jgi:HPt (histidine-containing phosphotransfer) domain-containing protein